VENVVGRHISHPLSHDLDAVLGRTRDIWEDLRGARVFLTGGSGFVGSWLLDTFAWAVDRLALDASIVVLTRDSGAFAAKVPHVARHAAVTVLEGDVRSLPAAVERFTHVIHAAADPGPIVTVDDRLRMFDTIVTGTRRMLDLAASARASRFLLTSSGAVYGVQPPSLSHVSEEYGGAPDSTNPAHAYGEAKRAAEALCAVSAGAGFTPTIARCFAFVGPRLPLDANFAVGNFVRDGLRGGPVRIEGDGTPLRSYLYAADLAAWLWTILLRGKSARAYNVGSERALTIRELAETVRRVADPRIAIDVRSAPASGPAPRYVPSTARARAELALTETVSLEQGIQQMLAWHRERSCA
jgi:dTDP-glucose 4,6-dehydratase